MPGKKRKKTYGLPIALILLVMIILVVTYFIYSLHMLGTSEHEESIEILRGEEGADSLTESEDQIVDPFDDDPDDVMKETAAGEDTENSDRDGTNDNDRKEGELKVIADGDDLLALVTKETKLKKDYEPEDLVAIPAYMNPYYDMKIRAVAFDYLESMWHAAKSDGVVLSIRSAYRSYSTQEKLFEDYASRHGIEEANRFSARAGQSEHQLGTAVDFGGTGKDFTAAFAITDQGQWLAENAFRYGFVISYPEGKEHITGYIFEPWHYRFIGVDEALEWKKTGKTLKEYLEMKKQYPD